LPEKGGEFKKPFQGHQYKRNGYEYPGNIVSGPANHGDRHNSRDQLNDHGQEQGNFKDHFFSKVIDLKTKKAAL
jgi:hypothetical protein